MSSGELSRDDIIAGLQDIIAAMRAMKQRGRIRIVGGAAIWLGHSAHREATVDVDALITPRDEVLTIARTVATRRGWPDDWINDAAAQFLPSGMGQPAGWISIFDEDGIIVEYADDRTLLAMKMQAANRRGRRDMADILALVAKLGIRDADEAEEIYGNYYPGDALTERARVLLDNAFEQGIPDIENPDPIPPLG
ncbi:hypothetical protein [Schumannella soli]|uniref:Nucleotidyl transferase AbiEii/AbiGii toxin family protein n=1 Tax=Schumannella soli TaxID=2590779 RepID=A0A506Y596_9MICO|nr:hypothetical protein [Schumannella soli]TPW76198.1 hypothetical protein FJ657_10385 [Schumannella soli]